jgi:pantoate--beta-alanine ligase
MNDTTTVAPRAMATLRTIAALREALRDAQAPIGLVPTMGALHDGHLTLLERARAECATVVMSLFVNPAQFAPGEDLASYPSSERADGAIAAAAGVDFVFAPAAAEIYPDGFATTVHVAGISDSLEGAARGAKHFDGVATVVTKLLNIVSPQIAYFGQKDAQQALVIKRLVDDLNMAVLIEVCPTVRAADGLALSSRNAYLSAADRTAATALYRGLSAAAARIAAGERDIATARAAALEVLEAEAIAPEYLELADPETLTPPASVSGPVLIAVAARVGGARLIDNVIATPGQETR